MRFELYSPTVQAGGGPDFEACRPEVGDSAMVGHKLS